MAESTRDLLDKLYHTHSRQVLATLIRLLGDFDAAEEALQDAFAAAISQWQTSGVPDNPVSWLISAGRFKAIDRLRKHAKRESSLDQLALDQLPETATVHADHVAMIEDESIEDDQLRLIFTCCHPALALEAQVALTLREVCDLTTEQIATALLKAPTTVAQRIVRAKAKIRDAKIPYQVPALKDIPDRLDAVLQVIYLVFNEGYATPACEQAPQLAGEAIRLARRLLSLLPEAEVRGLLALMLLHESRRPARIGKDGQIVLLADQDRSLWDQDLITEGKQLVAEAWRSGQVGGYCLQAAIASLHADALEPAATDWDQIVSLYTVLESIDPSPVIRLNRAVAVAMRDGPAAGLDLIDSLLDQGDLVEYHLAYAARADLCRRLGHFTEAQRAYETALTLAKHDPEREFLSNRLREITATQSSVSKID